MTNKLGDLHVATVDLMTMRYLSGSRPATEEEALQARFNERNRAMSKASGHMQQVIDAGQGARGQVVAVTTDPALPDAAGNGTGAICLEIRFEVSGNAEQRQAQAAAILGLGWARLKP